jgi:chromate transporter
MQAGGSATVSTDTTSLDGATAPPPPSVGALFLGFLSLGLTGFGGVLPMARSMIVERRRWLTGPEFTELLSLCQFLPGANIVNMSIAVGLHFRGVPGAVASIMGLIAAPSAVVIALGVIYERFEENPHLQHLFAGLAAAAAGLLVSTALKIAAPLRKRYVSLAVVALCFTAIAALRLPLLLTMAVLAPLSILLTWKFNR